MIPKNEYSTYFEHYIKLVSKEEKSVIENLGASQKEFNDLLRNFSLKQSFDSQILL